MANRIPPPRDFNWGRTLRTLSFWALLIAGSIALVQFASSRRQDAADISYSQFTEQLETGNVSTVEITERQQVRGELVLQEPECAAQNEHGEQHKDAKERGLRSEDVPVHRRVAERAKPKSGNIDG